MEIKMKLTSLLGLILLMFSCGTAKEAYVDTRYELCEDKCKLTYSKYESQKMSECMNACSKKKYEQK